ncbi:MAG: type II secretion system protein GspL [Pseudomonadota bacterium]
MTDDVTTLILLPLPLSEEDSARRFAWWKCVTGKCVQQGEGDDVRDAAGLSPDHDAPTVILLVPADICVVRSHQMADMTAPQALVAARIAALDNSITENADLHVGAALIEHVAADNADESALDQPAHHVETAVVARADLQPLLEDCQAMDCDPNHIVPAALVMPLQGEAASRFGLGPYAFLRTPDLATEDDPALRDMLIGETDCIDIPDDKVVAALGSLSVQSLPDLRQGDFAKRQESAVMEPRQKQLLFGLVAALIVITLLIPALRMWRYQSATETMTSETVAKAKPLLPAATDLNSAEQQVDAALLARGAGARIFTAPTAALFSLMQKVDNITIRDLGYRADGTLTAVVAAPDNATMNQLLLPLQEQGYIITATQRAEAGGASVIDLTVRG